VLGDGSPALRPIFTPRSGLARLATVSWISLARSRGRWRRFFPRFPMPRAIGAPDAHPRPARSWMRRIRSAAAGPSSPWPTALRCRPHPLSPRASSAPRRSRSSMRRTSGFWCRSSRPRATNSTHFVGTWFSSVGTSRNGAAWSTAWRIDWNRTSCCSPSGRRTASSGSSINGSGRRTRHTCRQRNSGTISLATPTYPGSGPGASSGARSRTVRGPTTTGATRRVCRTTTTKGCPWPSRSRKCTSMGPTCSSAQRRRKQQLPQAGSAAVGGDSAAPSGATSAPASAHPTKKLQRFHGSVRLDPKRLGTSSASIGDEILQHLEGLPDADVTVTLDIEARVPDGIPDKIVRDISENAKVLGFEEGYGFEED